MPLFEKIHSDLYELVFYIGLWGIVSIIIKQKRGKNPHGLIDLLFVALFMLLWRLCFGSKITTSRYFELLIIPWTLLFCYGVIDLSKKIDLVLTKLILKNKTNRQGKLTGLLIIIVLFFEIIALFDVDIYRHNIVSVYSFFSDKESSVKREIYLNDKSNDHNRISFYMLANDRDTLRSLNVETIPYLNELYPDFLYGPKEILFINEEKCDYEPVFEEILNQLSKYGKILKKTRLFTSKKKKKNVCFYHFSPTNKYANSNPIHVAGTHSCVFSKPDIKFEATKIMDDDATTVTGKTSRMYFKDFISVPLHNRIDMSVTVKNIGSTPTKVSTGYSVYNKNKERVWKECFPYNYSNNILIIQKANQGESVVTAQASSFQWEKDCKIALDAVEDLSDIPNLNLLSGTILDTRNNNDGTIEITISSPLDKTINSGTPFRVTNKAGAPNLYMTEAFLEPGDVLTFSSSIAKYETYHSYSKAALPAGIYYVKPLLFSTSLDRTQENTIQYLNWNIRY